MATVYVNQSVSFPSLPKKRTLLGGAKSIPQFSKNLKQVKFVTKKQWDSGVSTPVKCYYVISKLLRLLSFKLLFKGSIRSILTYFEHGNYHFYQC